jgi:hypothetical protein
MQFKATLFLSLFAAAQVALAQPPACLLAALKYVQWFSSSAIDDVAVILI